MMVYLSECKDLSSGVLHTNLIEYKNHYQIPESTLRG